jgi:hypothetical protein
MRHRAAVSTADSLARTASSELHLEIEASRSKVQEGPTDGIEEDAGNSYGPPVRREFTRQERQRMSSAPGGEVLLAAVGSTGAKHTVAEDVLQVAALQGLWWRTTYQEVRQGKQEKETFSVLRGLQVDIFVSVLDVQPIGPVLYIPRSPRSSRGFQENYRQCE